jgi:hypothetical protein
MCLPASSSSGTPPASTGGADSGASGAGGNAGDAGRVTGNVLISDQYNNRIVEITRAGSIVWSFGNGASVPGPADSTPTPTRAVRLANGQTLVSDRFNNEVIEVDTAQNIIFTYGQFTAGNGANLLNGPHDAKVVGDFTGLTPPQ